MEILRYTDPCPTRFKGGVLTFGNFDGLHKGHVAVLHHAKILASEHDCPFIAMSFEPHPVSVVKGIDLPRITPMKIKCKLLKKEGLDALFLINFTKAFSEITAETFIENILIKALEVRHILIGHDWFFGHERKGNAKLLRQFGKKNGFTVTSLPPLQHKEHIISSSRIRSLLLDGKMAEATELLGHPYIIEGTVLKGDKRGRTLGFPTANITLNGYLSPPYGVYVVSVEINEDQEVYQAVANIGIRPTFGGNTPLIEIFLLNFEGDLYGKELSVSLLHFLRNEQSFTSTEALITQINHDIKEAICYFAS